MLKQQEVVWFLIDISFLNQPENGSKINLFDKILKHEQKKSMSTNY